MNRLDKALRYAAGHASAGSAKWASFLAGGGGASGVHSDGKSIEWSRIVLSGWSRGSAYPIHIAKFFAGDKRAAASIMQ